MGIEQIRKTFFGVALAAFVGLDATAAEVGGVKIDDKARVGKADLQLNGAGVRKRAIFHVYAVGLYLSEKKTDPALAIASQGPKRLAIHMLRDVASDQLNKGLVDRFRANNSEANVRAFDPQVQQLLGAIVGLKEVKKGTAIYLDWTGTETQLLVDGKLASRPIPEEEFYRALLRIWLGEKPAQDDLKKALLGQHS